MTPITEETYKNAKEIVQIYESEQIRLNRYKGKSQCPFCGGTKTTPFVRPFKSQNCTECDKDGQISNRYLASLDLTDFIQKPSNL